MVHTDEISNINLWKYCLHNDKRLLLKYVLLYNISGIRGLVTPTICSQYSTDPFPEQSNITTVDIYIMVIKPICIFNS